MGNPFVHLDLACDDPEAAKKFYKSIFDWKFQDFPAMSWTGIDVGTGTGGGLGKKQQPGTPTAWTAYVNVDDVKKTIEKARKAGATILLPFMEVPNMGYLAVFQDPQGAQIGVWQNAAKPATAAPPAAEEQAAARPKDAAKEPGKLEPKAAKAPKVEPRAEPKAEPRPAAKKLEPGPNKTSMRPPPVAPKAPAKAPAKALPAAKAPAKALPAAAAPAKKPAARPTKK
ncbi:MAG TPA: VOC family protein [Kofleriaceae bacterium]|nr:VOC family protein [Kofleriaceae bacterium]